MASLPGVYTTAVGYCGGMEPNPSYRKVCNDPIYGDYAEAVTIDYDPTTISYEGILEAFFRCHDPMSGGRSRQYASIIFTHDGEQAETAQRLLAARPGVKTVAEPASDFWDAEAYHQKWLLQRKRPLFVSLGMVSREELLGAPATVLNAVAAGKLRPDIALERLEKLMLKGELRGEAHGAIAAVLDGPIRQF